MEGVGQSTGHVRGRAEGEGQSTEHGGKGGGSGTEYRTCEGKGGEVLKDPPPRLCMALCVCTPSGLRPHIIIPVADHRIHHILN